MKSDTLNGVLTFILGGLVVLAVIFALKVYFITRETRALQGEALAANARLVQTQALFNDAKVYNQNHPSPELNQIIQSMLQTMQAKPANR
jgi:hypothetical protein